MTPTFVEYREVGIREPLRQGDVLEALDPDATMWRRHLFVITADCDFANEKHQGRVTCVPLLLSDEYLHQHTIPRLREKYLQAKVLPALRLILSKTNGADISDERLRAWPLELPVAEIVADLALSGAGAAQAAASFEAIRILGEETRELQQAVTLLVDAQIAGPNAKSRDNILRSVQDALHGPFTTPPGDAFFVSSFAATHDVGYFAYLRHIEQILEEEITLGPKRLNTQYRRVSRLQDRYIHALVQRFALVFMSIGLPDEYEKTRELHAQILGESFR